MRRPIIPDWPAPPNVRAISSLRDGGVSQDRYRSLNLGDHVGDLADAVRENRHRLREAHELPNEPAWLHQVHGTVVADLDRLDGSMNADAAMTAQRATVCAILTADCLPVLFTDVDGERIGAAHAGWRGLVGGVLESTVKALNIEPGRLLVWLGPCIGPNHFEVGAEVRDLFINADPHAQQAFVANQRGRFMTNLPALARQRLHAIGVQQVYGGVECTYSDAERFFSHRRDGRTGRQATLIWKIG